jgi:hypothetical protein
MKYFFILLLMAAGALAYFRYTNPHIWNQYVDALKAPEQIDSAMTTQANPASAKSTPVQPEIISNSVLMNPDHTRPVDQPADTAAPTNAPSTNSAPASSGTTP